MQRSFFGRIGWSCRKGSVDFERRLQRLATECILKGPFPVDEAAVTPTLQAILIADHVYVDRITNKKVVAGIFHSINTHTIVSSETPSADSGDGSTEEGEDDTAERVVQIPKAGFTTGSPFAYLSVTDIIGEQEFSLRYVRLRDERVLFSIALKCQTANRLDPAELVIPLPPLPSDHEGVFALELLWNDESLGSYRVTVVDLDKQQQGAES